MSHFVVHNVVHTIMNGAYLFGDVLHASIVLFNLGVQLFVVRGRRDRRPNLREIVLFQPVFEEPFVQLGQKTRDDVAIGIGGRTPQRLHGTEHVVAVHVRQHVVRNHVVHHVQIVRTFAVMRVMHDGGQIQPVAQIGVVEFDNEGFHERTIF